MNDIERLKLMKDCTDELSRVLSKYPVAVSLATISSVIVTACMVKGMEKREFMCNMSSTWSEFEGPLNHYIQENKS